MFISVDERGKDKRELVSNIDVLIVVVRPQDAREVAIDLVRKDQNSFDKLIDQISTKGGTTEAGINVMQNSELSDIINHSFDEAISRVKK